MLLIQANQIQKSYGTKTVLDFAQLLVYEGERIGIVGANGVGKSTLLGVLSGDIPPDGGSVVRNGEIAYIRQFEELDGTRSGGENAKRAILARTAGPSVILCADEPTANLDQRGQAWVRHLLESARTVLLVSHDRALMDAICTRIIALEDGALAQYTGNYTDYEAAVAQQRERQQQAYTAYVQKKAQLEVAVQAQAHTISTMHAHKKRDYRANSSEARLYKDSRAIKQKKVEQGKRALSARLERLEKVEKLRELPSLRIDFSLTQPPGNKLVVQAAGLSFSYGSKVVLRDATFTVANRAKVAVTGSNGAGKSTLLRLIHQGHPGITWAPKLRTGFLHQNFENLDPDRTVLDNVLLGSVQELASVRSVLAGLLFPGDEVFKMARVLSGGEKMRLALAMLLTSDANALLLDEPTNYLDLRAVEAVRRMIAAYPGTVLLVSHDARFVEEVTDTTLHLEGGTVTALTETPRQGTGEDSTRRTLLEMRLAQLTAQIGSAPPEEKTLLEARYRDALQQLRQL